MHRSSAAILPALILATAVLVTGCASKARVETGDARGAAVLYGGDVDSATTEARRHCAQYEKAPRLVGTTPGTAYFQCVAR